MNIRKKIFCFAVLCIAAATSNAYAGWTFAGKLNPNDDEYVNPDTARRNGSIAQLWTLTNSKWAQQSDVVKREFNCDRELARVAASVLYDGQMQTGDIVMSSNKPGDWQAVVPGSWGESLMKMACAAKN